MHSSKQLLVPGAILLSRSPGWQAKQSTPWPVRRRAYSLAIMMLYILVVPEGRKGALQTMQAARGPKEGHPWCLMTFLQHQHRLGLSTAQVIRLRLFFGPTGASGKVSSP